jgi:programmed cell death protein 5
MDEELEELKKRKLRELQQQAAYQDEQELQKKQFEEQKKRILRKLLTSDARERLGRIRIARPDVSESIETQLIILAQNGQIKNKINDEQLQMLLKRIMPKKRDIKIKRR